MSSVLDVPLQLVLALSLAAAPSGPDTVSGAAFAIASMARAPVIARSSAVQAPAKARAPVDFRFTERSWLRAVKEAADQPGIGKFAARIFKTTSGRHYAPIASERRRILALRRRPDLAFGIARHHAAQNMSRIAPLIGRAPTAGELYVAHLLGVKSAAALIRLAQDSPNANAPGRMSPAAQAHPQLFFNGRQRASAGELYRKLTRAFGSHRDRLAKTTKPRRRVQKDLAGLASLSWPADVRYAQ